MAIQSYKFVKAAADANGDYKIGDEVNLDDASAVAIALLNAGAIVLMSAPGVDPSTVPPVTDPPPIS